MPLNVNDLSLKNKLLSSQPSEARRGDKQKEEQVLSEVKEISKNTKETNQKIKEIIDYEGLPTKLRIKVDKLLSKLNGVEETTKSRWSLDSLADKFSKLWKDPRLIKSYSETNEKIIQKSSFFTGFKKSFKVFKDKFVSLRQNFTSFKNILSNPKVWLKGVVSGLFTKIKIFVFDNLKKLGSMIMGKLFTIGKVIGRMFTYMVKMFTRIMFRLFLITVKMISTIIIQTFMILWTIASFMLTVIPILFTIFLFVVKVMIAVALVMIKVIAILTAALLIIGVIVLIGYAIYKFVEWVKKVVNAVGEFLSTIVDSISKIIENIFNSIESLLGLPEGWFKDTLGSVMEWVCDTLMRTVEWLDRLFFGEDGTFYERLTDMVLVPIKEFILGLWEDIKNIWNSFGDWLNNQEWFINLKYGMEWIWTKLKGAWDWFYNYIIIPVYDWVKKSINYLFGGLEGPGRTLAKDIVNVWEKVKNWFIENVVDPLRSAFGSILNAIDHLPGVSIDQKTIDSLQRSSYDNKKLEEARQELDEINRRRGEIRRNIKSNFDIEDRQSRFITRAAIELNSSELREYVDERFPDKSEEDRNSMYELLLNYKDLHEDGHEYRRTITEIEYLATGGIVTDATLAMIAEANTPEMVIPLNEEGLKFVVSALSEIPNNINTENINQISIDSIIESVEGSEVKITNSSTENVAETVVEAMQNMTKNYERPETEAKGKVLNMGQIHNSDQKADMARLIAMGFVGPKRF